MARCLLLCWLAPAVLLCSTLAVAPPTASGLDELVRRLGNQDYHIREQAERRLKEAGKRALPPLRRALTNRDPEVRRRARRVLRALERGILFMPRRVTLSVRDQPLARVLERLGQASGYRILAPGLTGVLGLGPLQPKTFSYDWVDLPFWDAIEQLCQDAHLRVQPTSGDAVHLTRATHPVAFVGRSGPFRYAAASFQLHRSVSLQLAGTAPSRSENLTFRFLLFSEPRLPIVGVGAVRGESARDNLGNSMLVSRSPGQTTRVSVSYSGSSTRRTYATASLALERRSSKATSLKHLRGVVPVTVLVEETPVVLAKNVLTAPGIKKTVEHLTFLVQNARQVDDNRFEVSLTITTRPGADPSWRRGLYNRVTVYDEKNKPLSRMGTSSQSSGVTMNLRLTFRHKKDAPAAPARLVYTHGRTEPTDVRFEFRDIPLP